MNAFKLCCNATWQGTYPELEKWKGLCQHQEPSAKHLREGYLTQGVFETAGESGFMDVEMTLNVKCTSDDTMEVTSNDLQLDPNHPEVCPVGKTPRNPQAVKFTTSEYGLRTPTSTCICGGIVRM